MGVDPQVLLDASVVLRDYERIVVAARKICKLDRQIKLAAAQLRDEKLKIRTIHNENR